MTVELLIYFTTVVKDDVSFNMFHHRGETFDSFTTKLSLSPRLGDSFTTILLAIVGVKYFHKFPFFGEVAEV